MHFFKESSQYLREQLLRARLDHQAFEIKIKACELSRCKATCCHDGVTLPREDAQSLNVLLNKKIEFLGKCEVPISDEYFQECADGKRVKSRVRKVRKADLPSDFPPHFSRTRCIFLDNNHHCLFQKISMEERKHPWFYKPLTCWIHPILIKQTEHGMLITLPNKNNDPQREKQYLGFASCTHCGREEEDGQPAYEVLAEELKCLGKLVGRDFLSELHAEDAPW